MNLILPGGIYMKKFVFSRPSREVAAPRVRRGAFGNLPLSMYSCSIKKPRYISGGFLSEMFSISNVSGKFLPTTALPLRCCPPFPDK